VTEKSPRMLAVFGGAWPLLVAAGALLLGTREPGPRMLRPIALDILNCGVIEGCEVHLGRDLAQRRPEKDGCFVLGHTLPRSRRVP